MLHAAAGATVGAAHAVHQVDRLAATERRLLQRQRHDLREIRSGTVAAPLAAAFAARLAGFSAGRAAVGRGTGCLLPLGQPLRVAIQLVGGMDALELGLGRRRRVAIGMPVHRQPAVGPLDFRG